MWSCSSVSKYVHNKFLLMIVVHSNSGYHMQVKIVEHGANYATVNFLLFTCKVTIMFKASSQ